MAQIEDEALKKSVVLVVEPESIIRMETVQMVTDAGYAALDAHNTNDAMAILKVRQDIQAVFAEIRAPGDLNGMELGRAVAKRWPLVRLIMTSGVVKAGNFPADWRYIQKPYDGAQLATALRTLLPPRLSIVN
jgi:two-component system, response regulator PdtaR